VAIGSEGSGKTTWALLAKQAGATVVSDDIVVVEPSPGGGYALLGTPLRAKEHGAFTRGRWPLAALLLPEHGSPPRLSAVKDLRVRARLLSNLPFVTESSASDERAGRLV